MILLRVLVGVSVLAWTYGCGGGTPTTPSSVPRLSLTSFLAFGDSLTLGEVTLPAGSVPPLSLAGGERSGRQVIVPSAAYPTILQAQLAARYASQTILMTNAGKSGEHPHEGALRFVPVFESARPQAVLLWEGINSLKLYGTDLPVEGLAEMTVAAQSRGARVFLANMLPVRQGFPNSPSTALLLEVNTKIATLASARGAVLVNLYDTLLPEVNTIIGSDGLHPNEAGYRRVAQVFFDAITTALEVR